MKKEIWVPFVIHSDGSGPGPDVRTISSRPCVEMPFGGIGAQAAYDTKKGVKGAARYQHLKIPAYEDDDTLVYARPAYNRTPAYWVVFVRKVITIDLREIKGIPNTAKIAT